MSRLRRMSRIIFEDRTQETPEQAAERAILGAAAMLSATAFTMAQGNPGAAVAVLATALGQTAARVGAPLETVLELVKHRHGEAQVAIAEERVAITTNRRSDA